MRPFCPKHLGLCLQLNKLKRNLVFTLFFVTNLARSNVYVILCTHQSLGERNGHNKKFKNHVATVLKAIIKSSLYLDASNTKY